MSLEPLSRYGFSIFFTAAGMAHLVNPGFYVDKLPSVVPMRYQLVLGAGVFEAALGLAALLPRSRRLASRAVMLFLLCVIPVNLYHVVVGSESATLSIVLLARVLFLGVLSYWAYLNSNMSASDGDTMQIVSRTDR